ncbi:hypothetical protein [Saccharothrix saharensis]|nr:hypothetical protein [Saccharothrix saharensis]
MRTTSRTLFEAVPSPPSSPPATTAPPPEDDDLAFLAAPELRRLLRR